MNKIDGLRAALVAAMPELDTNPANLVIFVNKGRLVSRLGSGLGYEWRYLVRLEFRDFTRSPDEIAIPLLLWLRDHQPERLMEFAKENNALGFAADIIDDTTWDVAFAFELCEAVVLTPKTGGGWDVIRPPEPTIPDYASATGIEPPPLTGEIWLGDRLLLRR